jgi:putative hemolysin
VIVGELIPKNLALRNAEGLACTVAPIMTLLSKLAAPAVWLLDGSTKLLFSLFGGVTDAQEAVTEEEIKAIIAEGESAGVLEAGERRMISGVMRLADRQAGALMTVRADVDWINLSADQATVRRRLATTDHSRLPAARGTPDHVVGVIQTRELLAAALSGQPLDVERHIREAPAVPDNSDSLDALEILRSAHVPMALVHDEHGHFEGLITPTDILEAVAGAFQSDADDDQSEATQREDGSWLLSGWMPVDEMSERLGIAIRTVATTARSQASFWPICSTFQALVSESTPAAGNLRWSTPTAGASKAALKGVGLPLSCGSTGLFAST